MRGIPAQLINKRFGRLIVLKREESKNRSSMWLCKCDCGNEKIVKGVFLLNGSVKSCGCLVKEIRKNGNPKHNLYNTRIYKIWQSMKNRCYSKSHIAYERYGGKGISICDEWLTDIKAFYEWAIKNGYNDNLSIDRIDNNGNYEPKNCRWATRIQQQNNTKKNIKYLYKGEILTLAELSRKYNINYSTLAHRLEKNNNIDMAIEKPIDKSKSRYKG